MLQIVQDRPVIADRHAQITLEQTCDIPEILYWQGFIQAMGAANVFHSLTAGLLAGDHPGWIPGDRMGNDENKHCHPKHDGDQIGQPANDVIKNPHGLRL